MEAFLAFCFRIHSGGFFWGQPMLPAVRGILSQLAWSAAFGEARRTLSVVVRKAISSAAELSEVDSEHLALHLPATVNEAARRILQAQEIGGSALLRMAVVHGRQGPIPLLAL